MSNPNKLKNIIEAGLLAAGKPVSIDGLLALFLDDEQPTRDDLQAVFAELQNDYCDRGIELVEVSNGWRIQVSKDYSNWISRLWEEKPGRYSRALLETLALIAYRQPITRGEIEEIRGVAVSTNIIRTMMDRDWVHVVGHRDVPGRPALYATTREFLDYFGLKALGELPTLAEIKDLEELNQRLQLIDPDQVPVAKPLPSVDPESDSLAAEDDDELISVHISADTDDNDGDSLDNDSEDDDRR